MIAIDESEVEDFRKSIFHNSLDVDDFLTQIYENPINT